MLVCNKFYVSVSCYVLKIMAEILDYRVRLHGCKFWFCHLISVLLCPQFILFTSVSDL